MLAHADPEVLGQGAEDGGMNLALLRSKGRVRVGPGERGYDVHPPQEAEHLDEPGKDAEGRRQWHDALEPEHLTE